MALSTKEAPVYGGSTLVIEFSEDTVLAPDACFYLVYEGSQQRHVTTARRMTPCKLHSIIPGHHQAEQVQLSALCYHGDNKNLLTTSPFHFHNDGAFFLAQFLVDSVYSTVSLEDLELIKSEHFDLADEELSTLDQRLSRALAYLHFPDWWSILGPDPQKENREPRETVLHFAARLGLNRVAAFLIRKPGCHEALGLSNRNGDLPKDVALANGNNGLAELLSDFSSQTLMPLGRWIETEKGVVQTQETGDVTLTSKLQNHHRTIEEDIIVLQGVQQQLEDKDTVTDTDISRQWQAEWPADTGTQLDANYDNSESTDEHFMSICKKAQELPGLVTLETVSDYRDDSDTYTDPNLERSQTSDDVDFIEDRDEAMDTESLPKLHVSEGEDEIENIMEDSISGLHEYNEHLLRIREKSTVFNRILEQDLRKETLARFSSSCPSLDADLRNSPLPVIDEADHHKSMVDLAEDNDQTEDTETATPSSLCSGNDLYSSGNDLEGSTGNVHIIVEGSTLESSSDFGLQTREYDDFLKEYYGGNVPQVRHRSHSPQSMKGREGADEQNRTGSPSMLIHGNKSVSLTPSEGDETDDDSFRDVSASDSNVSASDSNLSAGTDGGKRVVRSTGDIEEMVIEEQGTQQDSDASPIKDSPGDKVSRKGRGHKARFSADIEYMMRQSKERHSGSSLDKMASSDTGATEEGKGILNLPHAKMTKALSTSSIPAATNADRHRGSGMKGLSHDSKHAQFHRQDEIEEEDTPESTPERVQQSSGLGARRTRKKADMTLLDFLNDPGNFSSESTSIPSPKVKDIKDRDKEEKKRKTSVFSRFHSSYRKKNKEKEGKNKTSHRFLSISVSNAATCDMCHKPLTNKPALRCEICLVNVHDNSCKEQIIPCDKFRLRPFSPVLVVDDEPMQEKNIEKEQDKSNEEVCECVESQSSCITDSQGIIWTPSSSQDITSKKRKALENFLEVCGLSPVKKTLSCTWSEASDRTKTDYIKKSRNIFDEVLKVLAPNQEESIANVMFSSNNSNDNINILDIISSAYNLTSIWGTQRQLLSIIANKFTLAEIQVYIPELTKYRFTVARKHALSIGHGQPISICPENREALTEMQISHFLDFAMSPAIMTDVPFGEMQLKLKSGEKIAVPRVILNSIRSRVVEQYHQYCIENEFSPFASHRSYMRILSAIEPNIRKCMKGLDNYAADGSKAFEDLQKIIDQLGSTGKDKDWCDELKKSLSSSKQYLKLEYKLHVSKSSKVKDHCSQYALSTELQEFAKECDHVHDQDCISCEVLQDALLKISNAAASQTYETDDQKDEILYMVNQSKKAIQEWKMHILRTFNQDLARSDVMENLKDEEILIERDWAMKFVPMMYRESQSKWFAKRGLNWHITVGTYKMDDAIVSNTLVHIFDNATQDATTSGAILKDALLKFHEKNPNLSLAYLRSDNAGCFHGYKSIFGIWTLNIASQIKIERLDFADPQGGKSICDRRAAHIKSAVRKYVNEGHDVRSADEFMHAVKTTNMTNISVIVALPPSGQKDTTSHSTLLKNIMSVNNVLYRPSTMRVWRQYGIGEGKLIKNIPESETGTHQELQVVHVYEGQIKSRKEKTSRLETTVQMSAEPTNTTMDEVRVDVSENGGLFTCPEEYCKCTFMKYGNLLNHLDIGKHCKLKTTQNLSDRTKLLYSVQIENKVVKSTSVNALTVDSIDNSKLSKGWALKLKREFKKFTQSQKNFMTEKFEIGERTGQKCDPEDVSTIMRSVKDEHGRRLFKPVEFLSASQIASFFSRISLKKRKTSLQEYSEEDQEAENDAVNFRHLTELANV